jgi:hypothetical protein
MNTTTDKTWTHDRDRDAEDRFLTNEPMLDNGATLGTVLEYDDWQWSVVTEIADAHDPPMVAFVLVDELGDHIVRDRLEPAVGCHQHYAAVAEFRDTEHELWAPVEYIEGDDIWTVLNPVHPDYRDDGGDP